MSDFDFAIIGAGIAGASLASHLAPRARVLLVEAEADPGYHATGRSAAFWTESYGGPDIQPLTSASGPWLRNPPPEISPRGFLSPRGALTIATVEQADALAGFLEQFSSLGVAVERLDRAALRERIPGLLPVYDRAVFEPECSDIDVAALHGAYLAHARRHGARLVLRSPLQLASRSGGKWALAIGDEKPTAPVLITAAGAWADEVAGLAGATSLGLQPMRRTMVQLRLAEPVPSDLPLVLDIAQRFYFKPDAGRLWLSPHDETVCTPGDAAAEEMDVALAVDRLARVVDWQVEAVERRWAGLRTFAPDRRPVIGWDALQSGLFWFAGQGGSGIQTAPATAALARAMLLGEAPDAMLAGVDAALYDPARFA